MYTKKKEYTPEEIKQMAEAFAKKWFSNSSVDCGLCGKSNCPNNKTCIRCGNKLNS